MIDAGEQYFHLTRWQDPPCTLAFASHVCHRDLGIVMTLIALAGRYFLKTVLASMDD